MHGMKGKFIVKIDTNSHNEPEEAVIKTIEVSVYLTLSMTFTFFGKEVIDLNKTWKLGTETILFTILTF